MVSRRAADDLGELFDSAAAELDMAVLGTALCCLDCADGGVEGAIAFSPLIFGLNNPERWSGSDRASLVDLTAGTAGTSLKIEASDGFAEDGVCPIVLLLYAGLDFMLKVGAWAARVEPNFWAEVLKAGSTDRFDS